ncbi:hypothetical protein HD806DRAFT_424441 [Xylariaceae sp. AK1471]|nr:hypothetical protein HD806DRAFT_424441 [Xylariaceae sp. AK1471]
MSLAPRGLDYIRDEVDVEAVSPLDSPDLHLSQDRLNGNKRTIQLEDTSPYTLSSDPVTTLPDSQHHDERLFLPTSSAYYTPAHDHINTDNPPYANLQGPLPAISDNSNTHYLIPERYEPIKPKTTQASVPPTIPRPSSPTSWWWWWEILAMIFSIVNMSLLALLLSKISGIPLEAWKYSIEPNSLIAILTTIGKAALLVPAASCIGQLKWRHYIRQPQKLVDLQLFDDASRGPWGSTLLVWNLAFRARLLVTFGFALVTILALGIDPSAQQVLTTLTKESPLSNVSVVLGSADMYFSKGFFENTVYGRGIWQPNTDLLAIQSYIVNGATGSVFQPYFNCPAPASRCTWDTFTTLGVCTEFKNVSAEAVAHCGKLNSAGTMNCTYSSPSIADVDDLSNTMVMKWNAESTGGASSSTMLFQSLFKSKSGDGDSHIGSFLAVKAATDGYPITKYNKTGAIGWSPPPAEVYYATFSWCAKKLQNSTASQRGINPGLIIPEELTFVDAVEVGDEGNLMGTNYFAYASNATGSTFNISRMVQDFLPNYLSTFLTTTVYHNVYRPDRGPGDDILAVGFALMNANLSLVMSNIVDTLTNQIRSNNPGDNYNATNVVGRAFFNEPYIEVRWAYLILPFSVTLFSAVLLGITIIVTDKQPLLKNSLIALLVNRLQGWDDEELDVNGPQTQEKLDHLAGTMVARLEDDDYGRTKLVRKKPE